MLFFILQAFIFSISSGISLRNKYLTANYDITETGTLFSEIIFNKKDKKAFQSNNEDFTISLLQNYQNPAFSPKSNKNKWEILTYSEKNIKHLSEKSELKSSKNGEFDVNFPNKIKYINIINFGEILTFKSISFSQKSINENGGVLTLFFGNSEKDVKAKVKNNQYDQKAYFSNEKNFGSNFNFAKEVTAQYVAIVTTNEIEITQFDIDDGDIPYYNKIIKSTDLQCIKATQNEDKIAFTFATYEFNGAKFDITEVVELVKNEAKLNKYLVINSDKKDVKIEYISFNNKRSYILKKFNEQGELKSRRITLKMDVNYVVDPLAVEVCRPTKEREILIRFSRPVILKDSTFSIEGLTIEKTLLWSDERTVTVTVSSSMKDNMKYKFSVVGVKDFYDNELTTTVEFQYFPMNLVASVYGDFSGSDSVISDATVSTDSFTIRLNVKDFKDATNSVLLHSKDNSVIVEITSDNHIKFTVGSFSVKSKSEVSKEKHYVTLVRERNAYLKIYFDSELDAGDWDKSMAKSILLQEMILKKNNVVYSYVKVFNYGFTKSDINVKEISLKNEFIERVFSISNDKVKTTELINYRTDTVITVIPRDGSEEFLFSIPTSLQSRINRDEKVYRVKNSLPKPIDRKDWHVTANSEQNTKAGTKEGPVGNFIDGNINTIWHSKYNDKEGGHDERADKKDPFQVTFDLGKETEFKSFSYTPRQSGENGRINHYELYVANSMEDLNKSISDKNYDIKGDFQYTSTSAIYVNFSKPQKARYVALLSVNHDSYGSGADFSLYNEYAPLSYADIYSSWFDLDHYDYSQTEKSQKVKFTYKPATFDNVQFNVTVEYELQNGKHYIEKEITIKIPKENYDDIKFDYIELDRLVISDSDKEKSWTHPFIDPTRSDLLTKYIISLGQPIYINSFFTGCRFPFSDNQIVDNLCYHRYQAGKNFSQLKLEEDGTYRCWKTVIGASRSINIEVIRNDFFSYITDISVENKFRIQYNSWYDWMKEITESNILSSFKEIEKGCTQMGVKPLDSYVIDDGWNVYNSEKYKVYNEKESGTSYNKVGFWEMNTKFPDGFNKPADFAHSVSSNFGVWLGPRGGYGYNSALGHMVEDAGNGFYNAQNSDIDVASTKYTMKLKDFFNDWINQYKVNYYKLDGWLLKPCHNENHDHVVGGYDYVYEFTDYWERYIDVFKSMRETAEKNDIHNLWISLTCYINPSPFHLQWSNSIWVQISNDVGYTKISNKDTYADQMLNYRDNVYYDFYQKYQFQFPQQSIYNHDPIYGKTGTPLSGSLNDDEFRMYLLMCGMRGTSFFELYYTYGMIDEGDKWFVNSEVLNYIEKRHSVLQHSQIFGGAPGSGQVYGYSAWNEERGTIAIRNPSDEVKKFTIKLNRDIGVPEKIKTTYRKIVLNFNTIEDLKEGQAQNYNDEIEVNLQPREVRIIDFEPEQDTKCAEVEIVKAIDDKEIQIRFNKKIRFDVKNYEFDHDAKIESGKLRGDLRTVSLYLHEPLVNDTEYEIKINGVTDSIGNVLNTIARYNYMTENLIVSVPNQIGPIADDDTFLSTKESQVESFTIHMDVKKGDGKNEVLIRDIENKVSVEIVDKHIKFTVDDLSVESKEEVPDNQNIKITCVRERNTMIKIYINGELSQSKYAENQTERKSLKKIQLCRSSVVYNNLLIASYGYSYKQILDI